jgi:beta-glucuronidase
VRKDTVASCSEGAFLIGKTPMKFKLIFIFCSIFCLSLCAQAAVVKTVKSWDGKWKLTVDGKDYFIKGIEYSADTVGERPESNDWMHSDKNNNGEIDGPYDSWVDYDRDNFQSPEESTTGDFALLKAMGANTIRIYHSDNINKKLLRDLYERFGIMVIMGNFLGAYTKGSEADWNEGTDYKNAVQRYKMKESVRKMVMEHKDEPYLLMWMLGNENDSPGSDANSTKTNTNANKYPNEFAAFVNSVCEMIKNLDPNHPVGICNATLRFVPSYARYAPEIDILGFNQYSGPYGFGVLWNSVQKVCDRPVLITEYGCDSYDTNKSAEDEAYQAKYHRGAWKDIEKNSFWGGGIGNSLGGVTYCWLDKWWLVGSDKIHDTTIGAWNGPTNDSLFNDEWLGIASQGSGINSPFQRQLKEVYYTYQEELWKNDITSGSK